MAAINQRLARKGRPERIEALKKQAGYSREQVVIHLEALIENGLGTNYLVDFDAAFTAMVTGAGAQKENRDQAKALARVEYSARRGAKSFKRKLFNAVKLTLEENDPSKLTVANFVAGPVEGSSARLGVYFDRVAPHVKTLDERLKPYFKGASAFAQLETVKTALHAAEAEQDRALANAPHETLALYEAKGRLLEFIERANRVARIAFDGDAEVCARFNKDLLLRASRNTGKGKAKGEQNDGASDDEPTQPEAVPG